MGGLSVMSTSTQLNSTDGAEYRVDGMDKYKDHRHGDSEQPNECRDCAKDRASQTRE